MATKYWVGRAHAVRQITTITVANTWAAADTAVCKINEKELTITCGSTTTTTATVAAAIKEAWMASSGLDGTSSSSNATSNFGGQEFGEFREVTATVSGSVVTLTANTPGKPFTVTVTETTAGTGTATGSTTQTATGPNHWDNVDNWIDSLDLTSGSTGAPANDDTVDFRNSNISCKYGLPNASKEVTFNVWRSYTGEIGLPFINRDDPSYPYTEYRQRYVRLDDAGTGTSIAHRFGLGNTGDGCRLCNIKHSTLECKPVVYWTGSPLVERQGEKALNLCCTANTSELNIVNGSVNWSSQDGGTSAFLVVYQTGGDSMGADGLKSGGGIVMSGGTCVAGGAQSCYYTCRSGTLRIENQTATISTLSLHPTATAALVSGGITVTTFNSWGGTLDMRDNAGTVTFTNGTLYAPMQYFDPYKRSTYTNDWSVYYNISPDLLFGQTPLQPLKIGF